jgi:hypothetical protein
MTDQRMHLFMNIYTTVVIFLMAKHLSKSSEMLCSLEDKRDRIITKESVSLYTY